MTRWSILVGDVLDIPADVLVVSANVYLNLSGGVGGAFALRFGPAMQEALHAWLAERDMRHVPPGTVVAMPPLGSPYRAVLHAVGMDAMYETSPKLVAEVIDKTLQIAAGIGARKVALAAIGTGYGRLSMRQLAVTLHDTMKQDYPPLEKIVLGVRNEDDRHELSIGLGLGTRD